MLKRVWGAAELFSGLSMLYGWRSALTSILDLRRGRDVRFVSMGRTWLMPSDGSVGYHLRHSVDKLQRLAAVVPDNARAVVDVGAHVGLFSGFAAYRAPNANYLVVEPDPSLHSLLERNLAHVSHWRLEPSAVSDSTGKVTLWRNPASTQATSVHQDEAAVFEDSSRLESIEVPGKTLDDICEHAEVVDVLKIDIQGAENKLIAGGMETLRRAEHVIIEVTVMHPDVPVQLSKVFGAEPNVVNLVAGGADFLYRRAQSRADLIPRGGS